MLLQITNWLLQHNPQWEHIPPEFFEEPPPEPSIGIGQIILYLLIGLTAQTLFGFWARSKSEEYGVNPWVAFACGFFLGYLGVRLVPLLKSGTLFHQPVRRPLPPPIDPYAPPPQAYAQPLMPPAQQAYAQPPMPPAQQAWAPPPGPPQPQYAPPQPQYAPPVPQAAPQVSADGYMACPGCGARVKVGRRTCMSCGTMLPRM